MTKAQAVFYIGLWVSLCVLAAVLYLHDRRAYAISSRLYRRFLLQPWKVITFAVAATGLTIVAPYTGDPTWDYYDALFMSVLTFTTAPWAVGTVYKALRRELPPRHAFVAVSAGLFSASWSHDLYLLIRDGGYPVTWWANLIASSVLYTCGGLFWSLDWNTARGVTFAFMEKDWPAPAAPSTFRRVLWPALLFMTLVSAIILSFLLPRRP